MTEKEAADKRWHDRVAARVLGGKIQEFKKWMGSDNGQPTLIGLFVILMLIAGAADQAF